MDSAEDLVARIVVAVDIINTKPGIFERGIQSFMHRCGLRNATLGRNFELKIALFLCLFIAYSSIWTSQTTPFRYSLWNTTLDSIVHIVPFDGNNNPSYFVKLLLIQHVDTMF